MSTSLQNEDAAAAPVSFPCGKCGKRLKVRAALIGKKVKCPKCSHAVPVPAPSAEAEPLEAIEVIDEPAPSRPKRFSIFAMVFVSVVIFGCAIWANLSFAVTNKANLKYFPPFKAFHDAMDNHHLGAEYYNIARAMVAGRGFADPFAEQTGPDRVDAAGVADDPGGAHLDERRR